MPPGALKERMQPRRVWRPTRKTDPASVFRWCRSAAGATEVAWQMALYPTPGLRLQVNSDAQIAYGTEFEHIIGVFSTFRVPGSDAITAGRTYGNSAGEWRSAACRRGERRVRYGVQHGTLRPAQRHLYVYRKYGWLERLS